MSEQIFSRSSKYIWVTMATKWPVFVSADVEIIHGLFSDLKMRVLLVKYTLYPELRDKLDCEDEQFEFKLRFVTNSKNYSTRRFVLGTQ